MMGIDRYIDLLFKMISYRFTYLYNYLRKKAYKYIFK